MELNAEQIKKALECCLTINEGDCIACGYRRKKSKLFATCTNLLMADALALINSQEQRNRITCQVVLPDEKMEEIKNVCLERVELDIKAIQADTVRKMQERLCEGRVSNDPVVIATNVVAKELLKGGNG